MYVQTAWENDWSQSHILSSCWRYSSRSIIHNIKPIGLFAIMSRDTTTSRHWSSLLSIDKFYRFESDDDSLVIITYLYQVTQSTTNNSPCDSIQCVLAARFVRLVKLLSSGVFLTLIINVSPLWENSYQLNRTVLSQQRRTFPNADQLAFSVSLLYNTARPLAFM